MPGPRGNIDGIQRGRNSLTESQVRAIVQDELAGLSAGGALTQLTLTGDVIGQSVGPMLQAIIANGVVELNNFTGGTLSYLLNRANQTGTQSADTLTDGATNGAYLLSERAKLALIDNTTYTPTVANVTNVASVTVSGPFLCMRVGDLVHVSGLLTVQATLAADTLTSFTITLPVASAFANQWDCAGVGQLGARPVGVVADVAGDRAQAAWLSASTASANVPITFTYRII